jgi:pimeloyl-CoA synthetase
MKVLADNIKANLEANNGRISCDFIKNLAENAEVIYLHPTPRTRICVMTIYSGHEVVGYARVLDPKNDVEEIGNRVAFENAKNELWNVCGSIALAV